MLPKEGGGEGGRLQLDEGGEAGEGRRQRRQPVVRDEQLLQRPQAAQLLRQQRQPGRHERPRACLESVRALAARFSPGHWASISVVNALTNVHLPADGSGRFEPAAARRERWRVCTADAGRRRRRRRRACCF